MRYVGTGKNTQVYGSALLSSSRLKLKMTTLEELKPTEKKNVIELVANTGIDVTPWASTKDGTPVSNPASNGGHCYEWVFNEGESKFAFCLWHGDCATDDDGIFNAGNVRTTIRNLKSGKGSNTQIKRALRFDEKLQIARYRNADVRVILVDGKIRMATDDKTSKVAKRELDPVAWRVTHYDTETGDYVLRRAVSPKGTQPTDAEKMVLPAPEYSEPATAQLEESDAVDPANIEISGWKRAYAAVLAIGHPASASEIGAYIHSKDSGYKRINVEPDLCKITVNCLSRGHHLRNALPRKTNRSHEHDLLFKQRIDSNVYYEPYDIATHGVWELFEDPSARTQSKLRVRRFASGVLSAEIKQAELDHATESEETTGFLNEEDMKVRVSRAIVVRRGQPKFRRMLLDAYQSTCSITGCTVEDVLEAAHIVPHNGESTDKVKNGLLLRADIHTLFDLGFIWIEQGMICVAPHLRHGEYGTLEGRLLRAPSKVAFAPDAATLAWHARRARSALSE